ncbi:hypothetical protein B0O99DRAFT_689896 [Bisporella sp. PMI_857]|nr:hypothetical protein B0O99DRAFT_689896 [Bisporella sp. PMI_857]
MSAHTILLYGDQADAPIPMIRRVVERARHSQNLQLFLQSAIDTVQLEVIKLSPAERDTIGSFHNVQDLAERFTNGHDRFGIAQMVLVFIARIGELILHVETNPLLLTSEDNSPQILALGICGGLLTASAAAVAKNVTELIEAATYLSGVACRVAVAISRRSVQIEDDTGSWAFSTLGANVVGQLPSILDQFHRNQSIPRHRQAYVAINANTWATVFGPPSVLKTLLDAPTPLKDSDITVLSAFGAVHAPHLAVPDQDEIIGESSLLKKSIKPNYKLISGSRYRQFSSSTLRDLLREIILEIFQKSTNPARLFEVAGSSLQKPKEISLFMLGSTTYLLLLRRSLQTQGFKVTVLANPPILQSSEVRGGSGSVAIVGMSGQFPGSENIDEMWDSLMRREELHRKIPAKRFDADAYLDETGLGKNAITTAWGCFLENPGLFDYKMFKVSPREALLMDPGQRLVMHATYEALEHAGFTTNGTLATDNKRVRTFIGGGADDWRELQEPLGVDKYMIQGTQRAFTPGRLHHHFKWEGATFAVDSACGSTATAVGLAYTALVNRDCDTAIAGGSNIIATPFWQSALSKGGFLSPTGGCKTFRGDADGYCRGEAIGVIVMKRLEDALQDNDNIISVIRGYARNHSAETVSITRPHVQTQERLYRTVLNKAGLEPHDISYVEMHGTGTTAGDSAELESVANVLAQKGSRENPLVVGAIKANLGHAEATSGISSIIKAAMTFQKEVIPPQVGIPEKLGKFTCLDQASIMIPGNPLSFSRQAIGKKRNIIVSNFDAAGGNSCFVLEEPPISQQKDADPRGYYVTAISAHSPISLEQNKRRLLQYLTENEDTNLANLAYTTTSRRMHHSLKSAYSGSSIQKIIDALTKDLSNSTHVPDQKGKRPIVFVFTGQGAHYAGMGKEFYKTSPQFRATITNLQRVCTTHGFPSFIELIADSNTSIEASSTIQLHLALTALQLAVVDLWRTWGIEPDVVMGHSIGEYAALYAAGVLSANDVIYLIGKRAELIQNKVTAGTHGMLSISGSTEQISRFLCDESLATCEVACLNSPGMVVVSGERAHLSRLNDLLKEHQIKSKMLEVPYAMHSSQMDVIIPEFRRLAQGVRFSAPRINIVSTLTGELVTGNGVFGIEYLMRQTRESVKFGQAVTSCISQQLADSTAFWIEIGPNPVCLGLVRSSINIPSANALPSLKNGDSNWKTASTILATAYQANEPVRWREYHREFTACLSHVTNLPKYAFDTRDFWITYSDKAQHLEVNGLTSEKRIESQPISTSLHHLLKRGDGEEEQSAAFTSDISKPSLLKIVQGHKLAGIAVCPAGVYSDMALTAARYLLTDGVSTAPFPSLSILDTEIDHPVVPSPDTQKVVQVNIHRQKRLADSFWVSFTDHIKPSSPTISKCLVRIRDDTAFEIEKQTLLSSIQPKIDKLLKEAGVGNANRLQGKIFYKLFSNLMDYGENYEAVQDAIISNDFSEAIATVRLPQHVANSDEKFTLSPYWIDALTHLAGFLYNGNPMNSSDDLYLATHVDRQEISPQDFSSDIRYKIYSYIERPQGSQGGETYRGHAYILHNDSIVGFLQGASFKKMPRKTLQRILGKADPPKATKGPQQSQPSSNEFLKTNGYTGLSEETMSITNGHSINVLNAHLPNGKNGQRVSIVAAFREILLDETNMTESELTPSTYFSEIGVDSLMGISILAALKTETGLELEASFLMEHPSLEDAQRALRMEESKLSGYKNRIKETNGNDGVAHGFRECNVVLVQRPATSSSQSPLFLIADGAGAAAAYIHLPKLGDDLPVFAVESPWVQDPENFTSGFSEAAVMYLAAVRAKQPHGPYLLGGWSAGGVFAYEISRLLLEAGEQVNGLIIIDIPGPHDADMTKVTPPTMDVINQIGMLSGIDRSYSDSSTQVQRLKRHMLSTVTCFSKLKPVPMTSGRQPGKTVVIWATKDILPKTAISSGATNELCLDAWFYPSRFEFGPKGWDALVGEGLEWSKVEGDHFSIMTNPEVVALGKVMQDAIIRCSKAA